MHADSRPGCGRNDAVYSPTGLSTSAGKFCLSYMQMMVHIVRRDKRMPLNTMREVMYTCTIILDDPYPILLIYHAFHKKNCLDAIAAGKHVLCEKAFAITSREAEAVFAAARAKDIFIMEAMWTRFTPLILTLQKKLFEERVIGDVRRTFCDFGLDMDIAPPGVDSRLKRSQTLSRCRLCQIRLISVPVCCCSIRQRDGKVY